MYPFAIFISLPVLGKKGDEAGVGLGATFKSGADLEACAPKGTKAAPGQGKKEKKNGAQDSGPSSRDGLEAGAGTARPLKTEDRNCNEAIYMKIIERYSDLIEEHEAKSISEIKGLVNPDDARIREISDGIKGKYDDYSFERDFLGAGKDAALFVSKIKTTSLPVNFWLSFAEMVELSEADQMDKGIMLCSILRCLGNPDARVFLSEAREVYVLWGFAGISYLFDAKENVLDSGTQEEMKNKMSGNLLYSFNDREYADLSEVKISD